MLLEPVGHSGWDMVESDPPKGRGSETDYPVGRQKLRGTAALFRNSEERRCGL